MKNRKGKYFIHTDSNRIIYYITDTRAIGIKDEQIYNKESAKIYLNKPYNPNNKFFIKQITNKKEIKELDKIRLMFKL